MRGLLIVSFLFFSTHVVAQDLKTTISENKLLDSLRKKQENAKDSVIFNSTYIRYTSLRLSKDSIQTLPLDTTIGNFQNYSVLYQPRRPTFGVGNLGLAARPLLFEAVKTIGFQPGFHSLDFYQLNHEDILFYRARTPYTSLYYVNGGEPEQLLKITVSQNIKKNWNAGVNYNRIGANGIFNRQRGDALGASVFTWYQSPNSRYNLFASAVFNTLKAQENGGITNDTIFNANALRIDKMAEAVKFTTARQLYRKNSVSLRNTYFIGRIDSVNVDGVNKLLPTNKVAYNFIYTKQSFSFDKNEPDLFGVLPPGIGDQIYYSGRSAGYTHDSTSLYSFRNELMYCFFLRPKSASFLKNELKIDAGLRHELHAYEQNSLYSPDDTLYYHSAGFSNTSLLGNMSYKFSDRFGLSLSVDQIIQGRNFGDFLYEASSTINLNNKIGKIVLGAYLLNKSPEQIFERHYSNHYQWNLNFDKSKILNTSFNYINEKLKIDAGFEYFLLTNHLYFLGSGTNGILPAQASNGISLLRFSLAKGFTFGKFSLDLYGVYQKTDNTQIVRTPDFYTFNSLYFRQTFFKVLKTQIGMDIRYSSTYQNYSYSPAASQFYIGSNPITLASKPMAAIWVKATLRKANLFVRYDYADQGLLNRGYYTTVSYPMGDRLFKFGVLWNFYD